MKTWALGGCAAASAARVEPGRGERKARGGSGLIPATMSNAACAPARLNPQGRADLRPHAALRVPCVAHATPRHSRLAWSRNSARREPRLLPRSLLILASLLLAAVLLPARSAPAEDGYDLWMRYRSLPAAGQKQVLAQARSIIHAEPASPTLHAAVAELQRGVAGLTGREPLSSAQSANGALMLVTPANAPRVSTCPGPNWAARLARPETTPEAWLLWFHHLPWNYPLPSGRSLWAELVAHYDRGVASVVSMRSQWAALKADIDPRRHAEVAAYLAVQQAEAQWWRDACIAYFQSVSGLPLPAGTQAPAHTLGDYKDLRFNFTPGRGG